MWKTAVYRLVRVRRRDIPRGLDCSFVLSLEPDPQFTKGEEPDPQFTKILNSVIGVYWVVINMERRDEDRGTSGKLSTDIRQGSSPPMTGMLERVSPPMP